MPQHIIKISMRKPWFTNPEINLRDLPKTELHQYFTEHPLQRNSCLTCRLDYEHPPQPGEIIAQLQGIPESMRDNVSGLDLDYARLRDEDLHLLSELFPKLEELSLGFNVGVESLGLLVEALPELRCLGLRKLNVNNFADAHFQRLIQATARGGLKKIGTLLILQTKVSPEVLEAFFSVLKIKQLSLEGVMLDRHIDMLLRAFRGGPLTNLKALSLGNATGLSNENLMRLSEAYQGEEMCLDSFLDEEERIAALNAAINSGALLQIIKLDLSHNQNIPPLPLAMMLGALPRLTTIKLTDMHLTDDHMFALAEQIRAGKLASVQSFRLEENPDVSFEAVAVVCRGMPNLIDLAMVGMDLSSVATKEYITCWKNLTSMNLEKCKLSPEALKYLISQKLGLKYLNLSDTNLADDHLAVLRNVCNEGGLNALETLYLGGSQQYSGTGLFELAKALPGCLHNLNFNYMNVAVEHLAGLDEAAKNGYLQSVRLLGFDVVCNGVCAQQEGMVCLVSLACHLQLEYLGLYCAASDALLVRLLDCKVKGQLNLLSSVNIMECGGIQPQTMKRMHELLPKQGMGYFEMGFTDEHAHAMASAASSYSLQNVVHFNATNNPFTEVGLSVLLASLPALVNIELIGQDLTSKKFIEIAKIRRGGKLQRVTSVNIRGRGSKNLSPEALVEFVTAFDDLHSFSASIVWTEEHIRLLAEAVECGQAFQKLTSLSLVFEGNSDSISKLSQVSPESLARLISTISFVSHLGLVGGLTDDHLIELIPLAQQLSGLTSLNLSDNQNIKNARLLRVFMKILRKNAHGLTQAIFNKMSFSESDWALLLDDAWSQNPLVVNYP